MILKLFHKVARYTKHQKIFVLYLIVLAFFLLLFPVLKISPVSARGIDRVFLLSGPYFPLMIIVYVCMLILLAWNMSFRFKNTVINMFGFREDDALFNFGFLFVILASFLGIGSTIVVVHRTTSTIGLTFWFYVVELLLIGWLVLTLLTIVKKAKKWEKWKIVNIVDEDAEKKAKSKKEIEGLFDKNEK